jgi:hypothetical protein
MMNPISDTGNQGLNKEVWKFTSAQSQWLLYVFLNYRSIFLKIRSVRRNPTNGIEEIDVSV